MNFLSRFFSTLGERLTAHHDHSQDICLRVANLTRNTVLATRMQVADSSPKRNKGLLGRSHLAPGEGLWILPCEAVHTFGMKFPLDLVYLDGKNRIRKLCRGVPPWRLSACLSAHSVLELPPGAIRDTETRLGDILEFSSASPSSDSADDLRHP
jgi:uncharacterized membrane protein (UPF0127 family)